jgi:hypothetical protein
MNTNRWTEVNRCDPFFASAPHEWSLPITAPIGMKASNLYVRWQQQEYITCVQCGFGFAAHGGGLRMEWHYKLPTPDGWVYPTAINDMSRPGWEVVYDHGGNPFRPQAA